MSVFRDKLVQNQKNNPEKIKTIAQLRRSGDKNLTKEEKARVAAINRRCEMLNALGAEQYEVDHIHAINAVDENGKRLKRGTSKPDNLQIVPMWYNRHKGNKCYGLYAIKYNSRTHGHLKYI